VVAVDSVVDFTFPDLGVNTRGLGVYAAAATRLDGRVLMLVGMNVALYSD